MHASSPEAQMRAPRHHGTVTGADSAAAAPVAAAMHGHRRRHRAQSWMTCARLVLLNARSCRIASVKGLHGYALIGISRAALFDRQPSVVFPRQ